MTTTCLIIGDLHFKPKNSRHNLILVDKCVDYVKMHRPTFVVLLGDTLDTHETVKVQSFNIACEFIERLSEYTKVHVLIGNHDYINPNQFLTNNHPFNPLKKWDNVYIVDKAKIFSYNDYDFFMCPYTPDGRFIEALNTLDGWEMSFCGFGHVSIDGAKMGAYEVTDCNDYNESYPTLYTGHIHDPQHPQKNVFYPGSMSYDNPNKVWLLKFDSPSEEYPYYEIVKDSLNIKKRVVIDVSIDEVAKYVDKDNSNANLKLNVICSVNDYKIFKKGSVYNTLRTQCVDIHHKPNMETHDKDLQEKREKYEGMTYKNILDTIVNKKNDPDLNSVYSKIVCQR